MTTGPSIGSISASERPDKKAEMPSMGVLVGLLNRISHGIEKSPILQSRLPRTYHLYL